VTVDVAHPSGSLDTVFDPGTGANNTIYGVAPDPGGDMLITGVFTQFDGQAANRIARVHATP
jgi:hypothetical protein